MFEFHGWATIDDRASWESDEQAMFAADPDPKTLEKVRASDADANTWILWMSGQRLDPVGSGVMTQRSGRRP